MQSKIIDIVPKAIGILTSMLIFLGIISSVVYYRAFSINILEQISIGEALLLFVSKFSTFAIGAIFGIIVSQFFLLRYVKNEDQAKQTTQVKPFIELSKLQKLYAIFFIILLFLLAFMGFSPFTVWTIPLAMIVRIYVLFYILKRAKYVLEYLQKDVKILDFIRIAALSIIVIAGIAMTEAYLVYSRRTAKEVTLYYTTGETVKTDSATVYLGKTISAYYMYHKPTHKAIVIKADQVAKMEIQNTMFRDK